MDLGSRWNFNIFFTFNSISYLKINPKKEDSEMNSQGRRNLYVLESSDYSLVVTQTKTSNRTLGASILLVSPYHRLRVGSLDLRHLYPITRR